MLVLCFAFGTLEFEYQEGGGLHYIYRARFSNAMDDVKSNS